MATFTANEQNIDDLFGKDIYFFEMGTYQRPYSWEKEHVSVLLDDLRNAMEQNNANDPYFMGSIVLIKEEGQPISDRHLEV